MLSQKNHIFFKFGATSICALILFFSINNIALAASTTISTTTGSSTGTTTSTTKPFEMLNPLLNLQVKIPGLEKLVAANPASCDTANGQTSCTLPWISLYINAIYNYSIAIVGILAAVALMIGGVIWLTSLGNASRVSEAKSWITGSLTGMLILFTSYILLNEVNPELVEPKSIELDIVKEYEIIPVEDYKSITGSYPMKPWGKDMIDTIKKVSAEYNLPPCWFVGNLVVESGGHPNVVGGDLNVTASKWNNRAGNCTVMSRRKVLFAFTGNTGCSGNLNYCHNCPCNLSPKLVGFNPHKADFLDHRFTWGLGLTQYTIYPDKKLDVYNGPGNYHGYFLNQHTEYRMNNGVDEFKEDVSKKWLPVASLLTPEGNLRAAAAVTRKYWCSGARPDGSGVTMNCYVRYGAGPQALLDKKFNTFKECQVKGIDSYIK